MNLKDFVASMKADLDKFEADWKAQADTNPDQWPTEMAEGDWYDQFLIFEASGEKP